MPKRTKYYIDERLLKLLGKRIRRIRKEKKITLQDLAFLCNDIDYSYLNKIELGQINFSISYLFLIAEKLEIDVNELLVLDN